MSCIVCSQKFGSFTLSLFCQKLAPFCPWVVVKFLFVVYFCYCTWSVLQHVAMVIMYFIPFIALYIVLVAWHGIVLCRLTSWLIVPVTFS